MSNRITITNLRRSLAYLNKLAGNPEQTWTQVDGRNVSHAARATGEPLTCPAS